VLARQYYSALTGKVVSDSLGSEHTCTFGLLEDYGENVRLEILTLQRPNIL
jgi:hypothetical protein